MYRGKIPSSGGSLILGDWCHLEANKYSKLVIEDLLDIVDCEIEKIELEKEREMKLIQEKDEKRRQGISLFKEIQYKKFTIFNKTRQGSKLTSRKMQNSCFKNKRRQRKKILKIPSLQCKFCS